MVWRHDYQSGWSKSCSEQTERNRSSRPVSLRYTSGMARSAPAPNEWHASTGLPRCNYEPCLLTVNEDSGYCALHSKEILAVCKEHDITDLGDLDGMPLIIQRVEIRTLPQRHRFSRIEAMVRNMCLQDTYLTVRVDCEFRNLILPKDPIPTQTCLRTISGVFTSYVIALVLPDFTQ